MADLTTLDPTAPADTDPAAQGAAQIRTERADLIGWAGVEHALTGIHKFIMGGIGSRPAPGNAGRLFINTDTGQIEYDSGTAWIVPHANQIAYATGGTVVLTPTYQTLITLTMTIASAANLMIWCTSELICATAAGATYRILVDGALITGPAGANANINAGMILPVSLNGIRFAAAAGSHTIVLQGFLTTGAPLAQNGFMMVMAL